MFGASESLFLIPIWIKKPHGTFNQKKRLYTRYGIGFYLYPFLAVVSQTILPLSSYVIKTVVDTCRLPNLSY